jgi:hypothetical protein
MTGRRPHLTPLIIGSALAGLVFGSLAFTTANAAPAPAPAAAAGEPKSGDADYPAAPAGSVVRVKLAEDFRADLTAGGAVVIGTGATTVDGALLEIPIDITFKDGFALAGGFALQVDGKTTYSCPDISVWTGGKTIYCGKDGKTKPTFTYGEPEKTTRVDGWQTQSGMNVRIASEKRAEEMDSSLDSRPLEAGNLVGDMTIVSKRLLRGWDGDTDSRTGCWIGYYAGDTSIWRGWAIQAMVNRIPANVGVSQYSLVDGKGTLAGPAAPAVTIGQRTPHLEGISVTESKKIIRGSERNTDHFFSAPSYGCNTNAPYIVSQGLLDAKDVKAWRYDGGLRTAASNNPGGPARPQWWGHARQTDYDGPTGFYTWTCRGLPANQTSTSANTGGDTYWQTVDQGTGFRGDAGASDRADRASGSAPACQDLNLDGMKLTTRYSISKRGALEARNDQVEYPRSCSVDDNTLVGCWQEIYPLWDRAWAFQYHVYASALRAKITSETQIQVPSNWSSTGKVETRPITWRITDASVTGEWPKYATKGGTVDMSGIELPASEQDWTTPSPFSIPGTRQPFTVSGYGTPMGPQEMSFILTADTDGTWTWFKDIRGRELPRPQVKVTFGYVISNYDDGGSCKDKVWYDNDAFGSGRNNDAAGNHCIQGQVPTIWPLPANSANYWKRVPDATVEKDGKPVRNTPTVTFDAKRFEGCWQNDELKIQDNSTTSTVPSVGADFTWDIRLSGLMTKFTNC